ncbi:PTS sugar transporter subunit IIA [Maledivibacter halophilus]|uniref:PTS system, galactitol-specific IIA component n=1 Tax=Maledivibacter halophilus TaxID=36842 RepID=A0A1T5KIG5_9FIRM|nr:PTS sugar transporter subunit IIA [Maledivibacter halophilus]SKC63534.1 PTS system, galactitol-specific IIA component [Maledivibacter halophilus]
MFFDEEIVFFKESFNNKEDAIKKLADEFYKKGLVKDTFFQAVVDREEGYPTGLNVNGIGVAIPHTDSAHIIKPQIGFMTLKEPVIFKDMVDSQNEIKVNTIFMLGLAKSEQQVQILQKLMDLFQSEVLLKEITACKNIDEFKEIMKKANIN